MQPWQLLSIMVSRRPTSIAKNERLQVLIPEVGLRIYYILWVFIFCIIFFILLLIIAHHNIWGLHVWMLLVDFIHQVLASIFPKNSFWLWFLLGSTMSGHLNWCRFCDKPFLSLQSSSCGRLSPSVQSSSCSRLSPSLQSSTLSAEQLL